MDPHVYSILHKYFCSDSLAVYFYMHFQELTSEKLAMDSQISLR